VGQRATGSACRMPTMLSRALVLAWMSREAAGLLNSTRRAAAAVNCGENYGNCFDTQCCASGNFGCMKKVGRQFAQCRLLGSGGSCPHDEGWMCPGWESCTEAHGNCISSKCCKDDGYACFRRPNNDYAQCRAISTTSACQDTSEWTCPGWELCSDSFQACTDTHCCSDKRFTCYQKHAHYAQCMRRGECVYGRDGDCIELTSQLGQCTAAFHDCHLTGCCERSEDHCYQKDEHHSQCRPDCLRASDWSGSCVKRELPSESHKVSCETLRDRVNIYKRPCSTQYGSEQQCNNAFSSQDNFYQPCVWRPTDNACVESSQVLACDCALRGKNCAHAHTSPTAQAVHGDSASGSGESGVMVMAMLVIAAGVGGMAWYFHRKRASADETAHADDDGDGDDGEPEPEAKPKKKKKKKEKGYGQGEEMDSMDL